MTIEVVVCSSDRRSTITFLPVLLFAIHVPIHNPQSPTDRTLRSRDMQYHSVDVSGQKTCHELSTKQMPGA